MVLLVEIYAAEKIHLAIGEESNAYDEYDEVVPSPAMLTSRPQRNVDSRTNSGTRPLL